MFTKIRLLMTVLFVLTLAVPATARAQDASPVATPPASPEASPIAGSAVHGINSADMDTSVDPAEDFYRYANGGVAGPDRDSG